ncbi:unnamed protein product [Schistosoma haematobium]|nr:unnamed protein product [Schistosoma haematobium]
MFLRIQRTERVVPPEFTALKYAYRPWKPHYSSRNPSIVSPSLTNLKTNSNENEQIGSLRRKLADEIQCTLNVTKVRK